MIIIHTEHICVKHTRFAHTCRNMFTHTDTVSDVSLSLSFSLLFTVSCGFSSWQQMRRVTWPENSQHLIGSWQTFKLLLVSLISSGRDLRSLYWEKELHTWKNEIHDCKITSHTHTHTLKEGSFIWRLTDVCVFLIPDDCEIYLFTVWSEWKCSSVFLTLSGWIFSCFMNFCWP